ncbi:MAG: hypothetical protein WKF30_12965, partial [Pyrinomonadaceae bacterium]
LAGRPPFSGATVRDVTAAILTAEPYRINAINGVSPQLQHVLDLILIKDQNSRYQSIEAVAQDLKSALGTHGQEKASRSVSPRSKGVRRGAKFSLAGVGIAAVSHVLFYACGLGQDYYRQYYYSHLSSRYLDLQLPGKVSEFLWPFMLLFVFGYFVGLVFFLFGIVRMGYAVIFEDPLPPSVGVVPINLFITQPLSVTEHSTLTHHKT